MTHVASFRSLALLWIALCSAPFFVHAQDCPLPGDYNADSLVTAGDLLIALYLFDGPAPGEAGCPDPGDANADGMMTASDIMSMLTLFGTDHTLEGLSCTWDGWSYGTVTGPGNWPACYSNCSGAGQSPIDFVTSDLISTDTLAPLTFHYQAVQNEVFNNGHTVEIAAEGAGHLDWEGEEYELLQVHFHCSSEHTIDGEHRPMEAHFVHQHANGDLLVMGLFFQERDTTNALLDEVIGQFPIEPGTVEAEAPIQVADLGRGFTDGGDSYDGWCAQDGTTISAGDYVTYDGSLTTPGCNEGVRWIVLREQFAVHPAQLALMEALLQDNNRPTQDLNGRPVLQLGGCNPNFGW